MRIKKVGVVGCGVMGAGIVHAASVSGFEVCFRSRSKEKVERDIQRVKKSLDKALTKNKMSDDERDKALDRIQGYNRLDDLASCDLIIETIAEDLDGKKEVFKKLDGITPDHTILTSNTSSFSITELAAATSRPGKFAGMHFFVPAQAMKLVEVVRGEDTTDETVEDVIALARAMGKEPVTVTDTPGFIVNHVLVPYLNQAIQAADDGLASREDIDTAVRLGFGITLGPLSMLDLIGLDVQLKMSETLYAKSGDPRFEPPRMLREMVEQGRLGRKSGKGFFDYD
jgi:3-hydroxybutyryl-CoA dehydrogenase